MIESKSRFARRIGKPVKFVSEYCRRGVLPTNEHGFVIVEQALKVLADRRRRGRPRVDPNERIIPMRVWVRRRQKKVVKQLVKELR